jgi:5-methylcytosine-specific restriction endonuclease McrA
MIQEAKRSAHSQHYDRVAVYPARLIIALVGNRCIYFGRHAVKMTKRRYALFFEKGTKCVQCGIEGQYFALERDSSRDAKTKYCYHFNLYAVNAEGVEVLMTKDHILPVSRGGKDGLHNLQPMCLHCNNQKGNTIWEDNKVHSVDHNDAIYDS